MFSLFSRSRAPARKPSKGFSVEILQLADGGVTYNLDPLPGTTQADMQGAIMMLAMNFEPRVRAAMAATIAHSKVNASRNSAKKAE